MMYRNRNLLVVAVIATVNALGYGIIIPILYSYTLRFGLSDFQNGLLFATFAICAFIATPVIGRLSDKYGRKPLLLISLVGTFISFLLMAFAPSAIFLFLARALDGITAGNISVAQAVISDSTAPKDRARGFGLIGAAFGFGFIFGPAISAATVGFGPAIPFLVAAVVTFLAIVLVVFILPETNIHKGEVRAGKIFDFHSLFRMLGDKNIGMTLLVSLIYSLAFALFTYAYQPVAIKILGETPQIISLNFTLIGIVGLITQAALIPLAVKRFPEKKLLVLAQSLVVAAFLAFFLAKTIVLYFAISIVFALGNSFVSPIINTLLSREVDERSQGSILGVNASYVSLGMIFGPIIGGSLATLFVPLPFLFGSVVVGFCVFLSWQILHKPIHKQDAFDVAP